MNRDKPFCCYIDPDTNKECITDPRWNIWTEGDHPHCVTQSCDNHVGYLLEDGWNHIWPLEEETQRNEA